MKVCKKCKEEKDENDFNWVDGRHTYRMTNCKVCQRIRRKELYPNGSSYGVRSTESLRASLLTHQNQIVRIQKELELRGRV